MKTRKFIFVKCKDDNGYVLPIDDIQSVVPSGSFGNSCIVNTRSNVRSYQSTETPEQIFDKIKLAQSLNIKP